MPAVIQSYRFIAGFVMLAYFSILILLMLQIWSPGGSYLDPSGLIISQRLVTENLDEVEPQTETRTEAPTKIRMEPQTETRTEAPTKIRMEPQTKIRMEAPAKIRMEPLTTMRTETRTEATDDPGIEIVGETRFRLKKPKPNDPKYAGPKKIIHMWNNDRHYKNDEMNWCPEKNCEIINGSPEKYAQSDAILFREYVGQVPAVRYPSQYYIFVNQESPAHRTAAEPYPGFFNMTMDYRRDGELLAVYGYMIKRPVPLSDAEMDRLYSPRVLSTKRQHAAWMVSNCGSASKRELYVEELQKYIPVHVYGGCGGKFRCPRSEEATCMKKLDAEYRFYLAFENSICKDYITEKFWNYVRDARVLPIVLKRSIIEKYVPPKSFIAVDDFATPKQLADYLWVLYKNDTLYAEYFAWRKEYDIGSVPLLFCTLCDLLHEVPRPIKIKWDYTKWWIDDAQCDTSSIMNIISHGRVNQTSVMNIRDYIRVNQPSR